MAPLSTLRSSALCKYIVPEYKLIIFQENGSLFHMRTFIYGDKSEVLSVSRTASQPSLHSSFVLPVMTKKKKKTFYKEFKKKTTSCKIQSCQNNSHISHSQPCRHARWLHFEPGRPGVESHLQHFWFRPSLEPGKLWSMRSQKVGHDRRDLTH